jgi:hypothetical protein
MVTPLVRLKEFVATPLWAEGTEDARRRRLRTLVGVPFAGLAGLAWGIQAAGTIATGSALFWGAVGATALACFIYLEQRVVAPLAEAIVRRRRLGGRLGVMLLEAAMVGGFLLALTRLISVPNAPGAEFILAAGAFYVAAMETVLGRIPERTANLLRGGGLSSGPRTQDYSEIDTLVSRGALDEAIELCRRAIAERPRAASLYIRLFRILMARRDFEGALEVLETCYSSASLEPKQEEYIVHQIYEVCRTKLDDPARAAYHIGDWMTRHPGATHAAWATRALLDLDSDSSPADDVDADSSIESDALASGELLFDVQERFKLPADFEASRDERVDKDFLFGDGAFGEFWAGSDPYVKPHSSDPPTGNDAPHRDESGPLGADSPEEAAD